jgi:hypothetical protein
LHEDAIKYRSKAEQCFSIACAVDDPNVRRQSLDIALYWFRLAEQTETQRNHENVPPRHPRGGHPPSVPLRLAHRGS